MLCSCNSDPSQAPVQAAQNSGEWTMLFNGRNLDGWRSYGEDAARPEWVVEEGAIVLDVDENTSDMTGGDLITEQQYENFELELDWKISEGGNSGLLFGVREIEGQKVAYETGIEMQILDDDRHRDGRTAVTSAGACYALYAPVDKVLRPVGEFNEVRLIVNDGHVEYWLNGRRRIRHRLRRLAYTRSELEIRRMGTLRKISERPHCSSGSHRSGVVPQYPYPGTLKDCAQYHGAGRRRP